MNPGVAELVSGAAPVCSLVGLLLWMVRRSEARVSQVTDKFIDHLHRSRQESLARECAEQEMHRGYQEGLRANTRAVERLCERIGTASNGG